jgi:hypothetical protein
VRGACRALSLAMRQSAPHICHCDSKMGLCMKTPLTCTLAAAMALSLAAPAYAKPPEAPFRAVEAQTFTAEDLERYGLDAEAAARGVELQAQGYQIVALTPEEAEAYRAGAITQTEWILIGIGVLIILAIA